MAVSKRIERIVAMAEALSVWTDIGCDHGFTALLLIESGKAKKVIATDISRMSLEKARALSQKNGLAQKIECREGDGLSVLAKGETEGVVLSGMGGYLIKNLLEAEETLAHTLRALVLSPNNHADVLRAFLLEHGFLIEQEEIVEENGKFYPILLVKQGEDTPYTEEELLLGRNVTKNLHLYNFLNAKISALKLVSNNISDKKCQDYIKIQKELECYKMRLNRL